MLCRPCLALAQADALSTRQAQTLLLELTNAERAKQGLSQLEPSRRAGQLAREHATEMARHGYVGHYDLAGRKCELRYNLLEGTDHVAENIAYFERGERVQLTAALVRSMFADLLASRTHRANILHPGHTHLGCAFVVKRDPRRTRAWAVQEFVNDWGDYELLPPLVDGGQVVTLRGRVDPGAQVAYIGIATERLPGERKPEEIGAADLHYRQPAPEQWLEVGKGIRLTNDGSFSASVPVPQLQGPLDLYVTVWVTVAGLEKPLRAMTQVLLLR